MMLFLKDVNYVSCLVHIFCKSFAIDLLTFHHCKCLVVPSDTLLKEIVQLGMADSGIRSPP